MIGARDLLNLAEVLSRGTSESEWRCAVGRAYYAAFHQARDLLQALGFQIPRAEFVHASLWKRPQLSSRFQRNAWTNSALGI